MTDTGENNDMAIRLDAVARSKCSDPVVGFSTIAAVLKPDTGE